MERKSSLSLHYYCCLLLPRADPGHRDFPPVWLSIHQKLRHCQRGVPGCPAGGNLLPSLGAVNELIVPGPQDTVNTRVEHVLGDRGTQAETSEIHPDRPLLLWTWDIHKHINRFLRIRATTGQSVPAAPLPRSPRQQHQHLQTTGELRWPQQLNTPKAETICPS